jgi:hydrogenase expression/formation protein HypC
MCLAIPGKILSVEGEDPVFRSGRVSFGGVVKQISLAYVPEAGVGNYVLVHAGFAINTIDEVEANQMFEDLRRMGELAELEEGGPS